MDVDPKLVAICTIVERLYHLSLVIGWLTDSLIQSFCLLFIEKVVFENLPFKRGTTHIAAILLHSFFLICAVVRTLV